MRFQNHLSAARNNKDYVIGKAIRKYGEDKFYVELLEKCLKEDRAKTQVEGFTKLGLMELTRKHICSHDDYGDREKQHD